MDPINKLFINLIWSPAAVTLLKQTKVGNRRKHRSKIIFLDQSVILWYTLLLAWC